MPDEIMSDLPVKGDIERAIDGVLPSDVVRGVTVGKNDEIISDLPVKGDVGGQSTAYCPPMSSVV